MRDRTLYLLATVSAAWLGCAALGCVAETEDPQDTAAPAFDEHSGQLPSTGPAYPSGPYGISEGSILPNWCFTGAIQPSAYWELNPNDWPKNEQVCLSDFYNPTGDGLYPAGSPWGEGTMRPKALLIVLSAGWCSVCRVEADQELPEKYEHYLPLGGQILTDLAQDNQGAPSKIPDLARWAQRYDVDYPMVIDPPHRLGPAMVVAAWPNNFLVDPRTMTLVEAIAGMPDTRFWNTYDEVLNGEWVP